MKIKSLHNITPTDNHNTYIAYAVAKIETFDHNQYHPKQVEKPIELSPYKKDYFTENYIAYIVIGIKKSKETLGLLKLIDDYIDKDDGSDDNTLLLNEKSSNILGKQIVNIIKVKNPKKKGYIGGIKIKNQNFIEFRTIVSATNALKLLFKEKIIKT